MAKIGLVPHKRQKEVITATQGRLIRQGLIIKSKSFLRITSKGEKTLKQLEFEDFKIDKPKKWDKKWRVLIFDIPETRKKIREQIRRSLTSVGFLYLQDSVWLYPYGCEDLVTLLKADLKIGGELLYLVVERLEGDEYYKTRFGLS